jgi:hypothetical protein
MQFAESALDPYQTDGCRLQSSMTILQGNRISYFMAMFRMEHKLTLSRIVG